MKTFKEYEESLNEKSEWSKEGYKRVISGVEKLLKFKNSNNSAVNPDGALIFHNENDGFDVKLVKQVEKDISKLLSDNGLIAVELKPEYTASFRIPKERIAEMNFGVVVKNNYYKGGEDGAMSAAGAALFDKYRI